MKVINITVRNKIAKNHREYEAEYVCGNSDFVIVFDFDEEWNAFEAKTARFKYNGQHRDVVFNGNQVAVPIIENTHSVEVGVFAGNLHTTTPAIFTAKKSILCGSGVPAAPADDVYNQIMEMLDNVEGVDPKVVEAAVKDYMEKNPFTETDPTVPDWAKAEQKPTYTAEEVGALSEAALQPAINTALAQAKASGEFDGKPGEPGKDGAAGQDGYTPQKGVDYFDGQDGKDGNPGQDGSDGITPHVGENGNWYIGDVDTGIPATGPSGGQGLPGVPGEDGKDGQPGKDGTSPVVSVSAIEGGHRITITDVNGTKTVDVLNGSDGQPGKDGSDGQDGSNGKDGNGIKSAVLNADYTLTLTFDDGTSYTTPSIRGAAGASGKDGSNGKDGASATHNWNGTVLTVTSASGTSSADLKGEKGNDGYTPVKGKDYFDGADGKDGKDGYTPQKNIDYFDGTNGKDGTSVTVSSVSESAADGGSNVVTFSDGKQLTVKNGKAGTNGKDGADGKTPVKGTDYFTSADKTEMVNSVLSALPTWTGGSY